MTHSKKLSLIATLAIAPYASILTSDEPTKIKDLQQRLAKIENAHQQFEKKEKYTPEEYLQIVAMINEMEEIKQRTTHPEKAKKPETD